MKKKGIALAIILIILVMTLVACSNTTDATDKSDIDDFVVTIHPNNGDPNVKWDISDPIPMFEKEGFEIEGYYLDSDFTIEVVLTSLKETGINGDIDVYIKWKKEECEHEIVIDEAVPATCTEKGLTEGKHCSKCGEVLLAQTEVPATGHTYSSDCDNFCNVCEYERVSSVSHTYDNTCDTNCNECGAIREIEHTYSSDCDIVCNVCEYERTALVDHTAYDNTCDTTCNECGAVRTIDHTYDNACDTNCNICGATRKTNHIDVNPADNSCDVCGASVSTLTFTLSDDSQSYAITDANSSISGDITIPSTYNGKPVTTIGGSAFKGCTSLTSITIPDSVTTIGSSAFGGCASLESLTIPFVGNRAGVTSSDNYQYPLGYIFGTSSYTGCVATEQYYYGSSTSWTDSTTYYIPSSLKSVTVTGGYIPLGAFFYCNNITNITLGDNVTTIGEYAFFYCDSLTSVTIGVSVTTIGGFAFGVCYNLTSIVIPDSVTTIGSSAFMGCTSLKDVYYTGDIAGWCGISFEDSDANPMCYADNLHIDGKLVEDLVIPDSVTSIGRYAFSNCTSLASITIPDSVTTIGASAFAYCSSLTSVTIGDSVTTIGSSAFRNCTSLTDVYYTGTEEEWNSISIDSGNESLTNATIHYNYVNE